MCASFSSLCVVCCAAIWPNVKATYVGGEASFSLAEKYEAFRKQHRSDVVSDHIPYSHRMALFEQRSSIVESQNAKEGSWRAAVNRFADYTDDELNQMLGYRRSVRSGSSSFPSAGSMSFMEEDSDVEDTSQKRRSRLRNKLGTATASMDWRERSSATKTFIRNQGPCGSCWAVAAIGALEAHLELAGNKPRQLSFKHVVNCAPNPRHCGGDGGCHGGTAELAMGYMKDYGVAADSDYHYDLKGACPTEPVNPVARVGSFVTLPTNRYLPMLQAVATKGPVVGSVDAKHWHHYDSGIFDGCERDSVTNHAVLVIGFGVEPGTDKPYWLIRNSWGHHWGQDGHLMLLRHEADRGAEGYCGMDRNTHVGVACDGDPDEWEVCGMCGILADTVMPVQVFLSVNGTAMWS